MSNRNERAQNRAIEQKLAEMLEWYVSIKPDGEPDICKDAKAYKGKVLYWLEPILPGVENPVLIEEALGDNWTLRMEPMEQKIQVAT